MLFLLAEIACILLIAGGCAVVAGPGVGMIVAGVLFLALVVVAQLPRAGGS